MAGSTSYTVNEDVLLTMSEAQLLANTTDVDGAASVVSVAYTGTDGILVANNEDGTYRFATNDNFNCEVQRAVWLKDDDGGQILTTADVSVIAIDDAPIVSDDLAYTVDEDGVLTLTQD